MILKVAIFGITIQLLGLPSISFSLLYGNNEPNPSNANRKPHLSCILFGNTACQITCDVLCDLYGCRSQARCVDQISCDCGEIYVVKSLNLTVDQYSKQNLTDLWYHNFRRSFVSRRLLSKITHGDPEFSYNVTTLLRQPHMTGVLLQSELLEIRPKWSLLYYMRPTPRGHINEIFDTKNGFDREHFTEYFDRTIDFIVNRTYQQIESMTNINALPFLLGYLRNDDNVRYIIDQLLWFPNNTLINLISDYSRRAKYYNFFQAPNSDAKVSDTENAAYDTLKVYLFQAIENLSDQIFGKIQEMKMNHQLPRLTAYIQTKNDVKSLMSLLLMFPNESMFDLMRNLMMQQRNDTYMISKRSPPQMYVLPSDIDELVTASVLERLLKVKIRSADLAEASLTTTTTTTTTTTQQPTTVEATSTLGTFHEYIKRFLRQTFGMRQPEDQQRAVQQTNNGKKNYPELQVLLTQLMEYLIHAANAEDSAK